MTDITFGMAEANLAPPAAGRDRNTADLKAQSHRNSDCFLRLVQADFSDIDLLCQGVRDWNLDFRPLSGGVESQPLARLVQARADQVHYGYARCALNLEQQGAPPPGCVTFGVLEESVRRLWWRGQDIDGDTVIVFPYGGELHSISGTDFGVHTISIELALIEDVCARLGLKAVPGFGPPEAFKPWRDQLRFLRTELARLVRPEEAGAAVTARPVVEGLTRAWGEACDAAPPPDRTSGPVRTMRKALERLDAPDWLALTPADLCHYAGVAERTLQNAFRDRFGTTPAAFLKARRLAAVHAALKRPYGAEPVVGDIAAEYGFWHTGQFATDYRRAYGELPSETLRRGATRR